MKLPPNDKRQLPFGTSTAVQDLAALLVIRETVLDLNQDLTEQFCTKFVNWIKASKLNTFRGFENFTECCYSNGTTETFDKFYLKNHTRRFRCFKGEYVYHRLTWRNSWPNWCYVEDAPLDSNDALVVSLPFSDTGNKHKLYEETLSQCNQLGIPVLVDCAYFGTCKDIDFNFDHSCITDITFSLSKVFPVAHARIGLRLTRQDDDDSLFVVNKIGYTNRLGPQLALPLLDSFTSDYIWNKYQQQQTELCLEHCVEPSATVLFGLGGSQWAEYNRGTETNRLSFATHYEG